jgi:hypothetical protein
MGWLNDWLDDLSAPEPPTRYSPVARLIEPSGLYVSPPFQAEPPRWTGQIKAVCVTIRTPTNNNDPGEVARTNYLVADRLATLCDEDGKPIGKEHSIGPGETERQIAGRLVREARAAVGLDFNRPLRYQPLGIA